MGMVVVSNHGHSSGAVHLLYSNKILKGSDEKNDEVVHGIRVQVYQDLLQARLPVIPCVMSIAVNKIRIIW